jgi:hypothetical protein
MICIDREESQMDIKILKISKETHERIRSFCKNNGFTTYKWVERILLKEIKKEESKKEK